MILQTALQVPDVYVWANERGRSKRWLIALQDFRYLVVLDDRGTFLLPWTAYPVEFTHSRNKLRGEYQAWCRRKKS